MNNKMLLRAASILMLLHTIGHCFGALGWKKTSNAAVAQVIAGMENNSFQFMGRKTTLASFYQGYGLIMIGVLLMVSIFLWMLADSVSRFPAGFAWVLGFFLLLLAALEDIYFFPFAAAFSLLAAVGLWIVILRSPAQSASAA